MMCLFSLPHWLLKRFDKVNLLVVGKPDCLAVSHICALRIVLLLLKGLVPLRTKHSVELFLGDFVARQDEALGLLSASDV